MKTISHSHNQYGYEVLVWEEGRCIVEYHAGNHKLESSQQTTDPRWMVPIDTLKQYARQTAEEMAKEHGVPDDMIEDEGYIEDTVE